MNFKHSQACHNKMEKPKMRLTKEALKQIIKEELEAVVSEQDLDEGLFDFLKGDKKPEPKKQEAGVDLESYKRMTPRQRADVIQDFAFKPGGLAKVGKMISQLMGEKVKDTDDPNALALEAWNMLDIRFQTKLKERSPGAWDWTDSETTRTRRIDKRLGYTK